MSFYTRRKLRLIRTSGLTRGLPIGDFNQIVRTEEFFLSGMENVTLLARKIQLASTPNHQQIVESA